MRRPASLRRKIIANSGLLLGIMAIATLYTGFSSYELARGVESLFRNNRRMETIRRNLNATEASLVAYLRSKSSDSLKDFIMFSSRLSESSQVLNREIRADERLLLERSIAALIDGYIEEAEAAVAAKRGRDVAAYTERYHASERSAELVRQLLSNTEGLFLADSLAGFDLFERRMSRIILSDLVLVLTASLLGAALLVRYSYRLTGPLSRLAEAARAVGRGEYDHELPPLAADDEIGTMAEAFSAMQRSVKQAFEELKEKAEVEKRLMAERVRVLDMEHKLKDAELAALQAQINPHFLFNTLAAGMQLALAEDAERTADFLDNLASFIRYALKPASRTVSLGDEIDCLERYIWLLKLRFGERYRFELLVDPAVLSRETPALVLQPLVENAVAHGLKDCAEGGVVVIEARNSGGATLLRVADNGEGMDATELARLEAEGAGAELGSEGLREGGIGLRNVLRRVSLSSGGAGCFELKSEPGKGTEVILRLPGEGEA